MFSPEECLRLFNGLTQWLEVAKDRVDTMEKQLEKAKTSKDPKEAIQQSTVRGKCVYL